MLKFITNLLVKSQQSKIRKLISQKQTQALQLQRNGKLREYAEVIKEIENLENEYIELTNESG